MECPLGRQNIFQTSGIASGWNSLSLLKIPISRTPLVGTWSSKTGNMMKFRSSSSKSCEMICRVVPSAACDLCPTWKIVTWVWTAMECPVECPRSATHNWPIKCKTFVLFVTKSETQWTFLIARSIPHSESSHTSPRNHLARMSRSLVSLPHRSVTILSHGMNAEVSRVPSSTVGSMQWVFLTSGNRGSCKIYNSANSKHQGNLNAPKK